MASLSTQRAGTMFRCLLVALMLMVVVGTAWQAGRPSRKAPLASQESEVSNPKADANNEAEEREAAIQRLVAEVALVCPASAMELERDLRASPDGKTLPDYRLTAYRESTHTPPRAKASITSIRVASRHTRVAQAATQQANDWLVDPESWYVPEDAAVQSKAIQSNEIELPVVQQETPPVVQPTEPIRLPEPEISEESTLVAPRRIDPPPVETITEPTIPPSRQPGEPGPSLARPEVVEPPVVEVEPIDEAPVEDVTPSVEVEPRTPAVGPMFQPPAAPSKPVAPPTVIEPQPIEVQPEPVVPADKPVEQPPRVPAPPETLPVEESPAVDESITPIKPRRPMFAPPVVTPPTEVQKPVVPNVPEEIPTAPLPEPTLPQPTLPQPNPSQPTQPQKPPQHLDPSLHQPASEADREAAWAKAREAGVPEGVDPHLELVAEGCFPSAKTCAKCHEKIYREWSVSSHAYANISPMFQKFEQRITEVSQGTIGYFCLRCHSPVATTMGISRDVPLWEQPAVAQEGITCVACHRVNQRYVKTNGERRIVPGDVYAPVYGGKGGVGVAEAIAKKDHFKIKTSPHDKSPGQPIHLEGRYFDQLAKAEYCTTCHQVAVHPGIKLEVVWEQYRASPAYKQGITCQDCHMGKIPGVPSGYECCAIAEVGGKKVRENVKHSNHVFHGPGYSIAHPGIFPFHLKADRWTMQEWLLFNWRSGWGTDEFEDRVADGLIQVQFPPVWQEVDDRYDAREIIEDNQKLLAAKTEIRKQVMENGSHIDGPFFKNTPSVGKDLHLNYVITNTNTGHNLLTASLGAQPQFWANVVLIGPGGERLWETGYTDRYGDLCDIHSRDVRAGRTPFDSQLFNLQTMFLITGAVGTDREFYLPVNVDFDQLPFLRPGAIPISVTNHPPFIRMESRSLAPLGKKRINYKIPGRLLSQPGRYRLSFRMRSRAEPIYFMDFCRATTEMTRAMNEGVIDVHPYSVEFDVR